jgi:acyl carrier protein
MVHERVREIITSVLEIASDELPERIEPATVEGWNSLRHLRIMIAVETEFGIEIDPDMVPDLVSDEAIAEFVEAQLGVASPAVSG